MWSFSTKKTMTPRPQIKNKHQLLKKFHSSNQLILQNLPLHLYTDGSKNVEMSQSKFYVIAIYFFFLCISPLYENRINDNF